jgi:hypothetical protein
MGGPAALASQAAAAGQYFQLTYPRSTEPGALHLDVTYTLWIPTGVKYLRAVIVHQHGCGFGANKAGETAAYDLHWQALAAKWDAALLGPAYQQISQGRDGCRLWCDPRNGSQATFLRALQEFAGKTGHAELATAPWCLWGHSGGGYWVSLMQTLFPERIVAAWLRSGTAFSWRESGDTARPQLTEAVYRIPTMLNPGVKEKANAAPNGAWLGSLAMFAAYRAQGAPIGFAPDPLSAHDCGNSRYLAIPFFDACLAMRLPEQPSGDQQLRPVNMSSAWLAPLLGDQAEPAATFAGRANDAVWLPNERVARAWMEYVKTGEVGDSTPPPPPTQVIAARRRDRSIEITWQAAADLESGLQAFVIERDGRFLAQTPDKPLGKFGRPLLQTMSYHDTPEQPLPAMRCVDATGVRGVQHKYRVIAVNSAGLKSAAAEARDLAPVTEKQP